MFEYVFVGIYGLEVAMKLLFYRRDYFHSGWNVYDITILAAMLGLSIADGVLAHDNRSVRVVLLFVRVLKLAILFKKVRMLQNIFQIFVLALPSIINLALLLLVVMYVLAVIGIFLFAGTKLQEALDVHANFQNLWTAFLTIFRVATFDGWNDVMHDAMRERTQYFHCVDYPSYSDTQANGGEAVGCGVQYAPIYFVLVILLLPFVFLNIFVAIAVENVIKLTKLSDSVLSDQRLNDFLTAWKKHDPEVPLSFSIIYST